MKAGHISQVIVVYTVIPTLQHTRKWKPISRNRRIIMPLETNGGGIRKEKIVFKKENHFHTRLFPGTEQLSSHSRRELNDITLYFEMGKFIDTLFIIRRIIYLKYL